MTRKTPLRSKKPLKRTDKRLKRNRRLRPTATKRKKECQAYTKIRAVYLERHPVCERCKKAKSQEIHHKAGRYCKLLCDYRMFAAICRECHEWIHANGRQARADGWIYDKAHVAMDIEDALRYLEDQGQEPQ